MRKCIECNKEIKDGEKSRHAETKEGERCFICEECVGKLAKESKIFGI